MKIIGFVFALFCNALLFCNAAFAGLIIEVTGPNRADFVQRGTFVGEIWATVTGLDANLTNEYLQTVTGGLQITGDGYFEPYDPAVNTMAPWTFGVANPVHTSADRKLIGHGGLTSITGTGVLYFRTNTPVPGEQGNGPFKLGTFTATCFGPASIDFLKSGPSISMYTFRVDGQSKNGSATGGYGLVEAGPPLICDPAEPSTIVLLGMGALALIFIRRRK